MTSIEQFHSEAERINILYPSLHYVQENGQPVIIGSILLQVDELLIDHYEVRIVPSENYPYRFPHVFETGGKIPHNIDWHVYPDGHSCIKSLPEEILISKKGIQLEKFIKEQVIPYFFNQKYREMHGFFLHERKHGPDGNIDFFVELFDTKDYRVICQGLLLLIDNKLPNRVNNCFCGSGKKYRKCHKKALKMLCYFSKEDLEIFLKQIFLKIT